MEELNQSIIRKQQSEVHFWQCEIQQYIAWYNGELPYLYYTPSPHPEERIVADTISESAILTWTELHQKPKYLNELQIKPSDFSGKKVLDVGAGPIPSATCLENCHIYSLDPLHSVYKKLGFPQHLYPNVTFIEARAENIPVEDHFFDAIISVNAIDHVDDLPKVARELCRIAKPDCAFRMHIHYHSATVCEPIEIDDEIITSLFDWVKGLRIIAKQQKSFSNTVDGMERYVLWGNT